MYLLFPSIIAVMRLLAQHAACTPSLGLPASATKKPPRAHNVVAHSSAKQAAAALVTPLELSLVLSDVEREHFREVPYF